MTRRHLKRCSTSLIIREMQVKTPKRYHLTSIRKAVIKKIRNCKCWTVCGGKGTFINCWWKCILVQPMWITIWRVLKILRIELYDLAVSLLGIYLRYENPNSKLFLHLYVHCNIVYNRQDMETTSLSMWMNRFHNGILLSHKKMKSCHLWHIDGPWGYYTNDISQTGKEKYRMTSVVCGILKNK